MNIFKKSINENNYIVVSYWVKSKTNLKDAAWNIAIGQSIGNPTKRSPYETSELIENHACKIISDEDTLLKTDSGQIDIAFPYRNFDFRHDGITHLLVNIMGGQLDIDIIEKCHVTDIQFPADVHNILMGPKFGISGIRRYTKVDTKPLLGGIVKPKIGVTPNTLLDIVKKMVDGGVNFIKEDEILSNPSICPIEERVPLIMEYLKDKNVIYCVSIHSDFPYLLDRVQRVYELGGNGIHVNFWAGLGAYKSIREMDLPLFLHFQKSGDKIFTNTNHDFHIRWEVICKLAALMGVDFIHAGMIGGYYKWEESETINAVNILNELNVMPALSCGFNPNVTSDVFHKIGNNFMANVGGYIHSHKGGVQQGVFEMKKSIDNLE